MQSAVRINLRQQVGSKETWEPYENVAETEALDEYEHLHGRVTVDTVDAL
jgi:hypothetical protein